MAGGARRRAGHKEDDLKGTVLVPRAWNPSAPAMFVGGLYHYHCETWRPPGPGWLQKGTLARHECPCTRLGEPMDPRPTLEPKPVVPTSTDRRCQRHRGRAGRRFRKESTGWCCPIRPDEVLKSTARVVLEEDAKNLSVRAAAHSVFDRGDVSSDSSSTTTPEWTGR